MTKERWISIAGTVLVIGGVSWLLKLAVIVATGGRVTDTGAAAVFYVLGLVLLLVGSTGLGLRLTINGTIAMRVLAVVLSPVVLFTSFVLLDSIGRAVVGDRGPDYVPDEAGILLAAVAWLALGYVLLSKWTLTRTTPDRVS